MWKLERLCNVSLSYRSGKTPGPMDTGAGNFRKMYRIQPEEMKILYVVNKVYNKDCSIRENLIAVRHQQ